MALGYCLYDFLWVPRTHFQAFWSKMLHKKWTKTEYTTNIFFIVYEIVWDIIM